jgi:hypothetical protein
MIPAVRIPADAKIRTPVEIKLKPDWHFDPTVGVFISDRGDRFVPQSDLPKKSQIVHKTPSLAIAARKARARLSSDQKNLLRHLQVILPADQAASQYLEKIRRWPCVAEVSLRPVISLPVVSPEAQQHRLG